jgi:hypothetical protein
LVDLDAVVNEFAFKLWAPKEDKMLEQEKAIRFMFEG